MAAKKKKWRKPARFWRWLRRAGFFGSVVLADVAMTAWLADLFLVSGLHRAHVILLILFFLLNGLLLLGSFHALVGGLIRLRGSLAGVRVTKVAESEGYQRLRASETGVLENRYVVVVPLYGEDSGEVCLRVEAMWRSLEETGELASFDFFLLSDTRSLDAWVREEVEWTALCGRLEALGRIFYRRRRENENRKAGNIGDFVRSWGGGYEAMLVLDADSLMEGADVVTMARVMEGRAELGILQTAPRLVLGSSVFTRLQQFAMSLYGPLFIRGLNFWQLASGSYWGHNALIRLRPFSDLCELPGLPGREPFGGRILSHDFVEAALMRAEGWEVWLAWDLKGSYEEAPPTLVDHLKRDRRWCQGNLQHIWLLFARRFPLTVRVHLFNGIMGYLASPLWFAFLLLGTWIAWDRVESGLSSLPFEGSVGRELGIDPADQGLVLIGVVGVLLFLPKIGALLGGLAVGRVRRSFGGGLRLFAGVFLETLLSVLLAPVVMVSHTMIVASIFLGRAVGWGVQNRGGDGTSWASAARVHGLATTLGFGWLWVALQISDVYLAWLSPIIAGLILSIPLSVWTSRVRLGRKLRRAGILGSPDENVPGPVLKRYRALRAERRKEKSSRAPEGLMAAVVDPYVNAIHVALLPKREVSTVADGLVERVLREGLGGVSAEDAMKLAGDRAALLTLHKEVWIRPFSAVHPVWHKALEGYRPDLAPAA